MKRLFKYLRPYWLSATVSPLLMMGEVLADLCLPFLMSFIVDYGIAETVALWGRTTSSFLCPQMVQVPFS